MVPKTIRETPLSPRWNGLRFERYKGMVIRPSRSLYFPLARGNGI